MLASSAAIRCLPACKLLQTTGTSAVLPVVDVHCHAFNASDLPVTGFVDHVVFKHYEEQVVFPRIAARDVPDVLSELVNVLVRIMAGTAPTADEEIDDLNSRSRASMVTEQDDGDSPQDRRADEDRLRGILEELSSGTLSSQPGARSGSADKLGQGGALLLEQMREEALDGLTPPAELRNTQRSGAELAAALYASPGYVYRHLRWAFLLTRSRRQIVNRFKRLYAQQSGMRLFTPALIDFSFWLDDEPESRLPRQIEVFDRLHRLPGSLRMHSFVPFDPWRQVVDQDTGNTPSARDLVRTAIEEKGFIGVKLYPPMGFRATRNIGDEPSDILTFPTRAPIGFPQKLDAALEDFYTWCVQNQIPVMAHGAASNPAGKDYVERADPKWWGKVLEDSRFRELRLNLAHFGSFDKAFRQGGDAGGQVEDTWEWTVGRLIRDGGYPHLYADLSYFSEWLGDNASPEKRTALRKFLRRFVETFDPNVERLMYGSDWIMLGREPEHDRMIPVMEHLVREIGFDDAKVARFFGGNALRFLGLTERGSTWSRMIDYYTRHGLDATYLDIRRL